MPDSDDRELPESVQRALDAAHLIELPAPTVDDMLKGMEELSARVSQQGVSLGATTEPFEFCENADGTPLTLEELVGQALGAASMCWSEPPSGDFISERASKIVDALLDRINQWVEQ